MLVELKLKNLALIEIIEINFEKGLNVFTGDSGSGKSLILDSLNVLFGGTNIPLNHLIRPGKEECLIEAKFTSSIKIEKWLKQNGYYNVSNFISIKRRSYKKKQKIITAYKLNDLSISKKLLKHLGLLLIDFAGQSDSILFNSFDYRRNILDDLGSKELADLNSKVKHTWKNLNILKRQMIFQIQEIEKEKEKNIAKTSMFNILEQANLVDKNEILELKLKEKRLANNLEIKNSINSVINNFCNYHEESYSISSLIKESIRQLNKVDKYDVSINQFKDKLIAFQNQIEIINSELIEFSQNIEMEEVNLEDVQHRLFHLQNLEKTFSLELSELIKKRDYLRNYINNDSNKFSKKKLDMEIKVLTKKLEDLYVKQSCKRKELARDLEKSVLNILDDLGLENANFSIQFERISSSCEGNENIEFFFSANPDQALAPISKVISGGEMSRFLLAFKSSISAMSNTFFFDEIDNGLSGKSLFSLVELIKSISKNTQVLCITHQPLLAASANAHFKVEKNVQDGLTYTSLSKLKTQKQKQNELVELIGGGFTEANNYALTLLEKAAA